MGKGFWSTRFGSCSHSLSCYITLSIQSWLRYIEILTLWFLSVFQYLGMTDIPNLLDILIWSGFFSCIFCTKRYSPSYIHLWKWKTSHNRILKNQLESVRHLLTFWHWIRSFHRSVCSIGYIWVNLYSINIFKQQQNVKYFV